MYEQSESKNKKKKNIQQNQNGNIIDIVEKILNIFNKYLE